MDSRLINEKAVIFKDRTLRMTPALFQRLGLVKKNVHLKLDEFFLSCIPFDISLSGASLLGFLSPQEISFFDQMKGRTHKLNLTFNTPHSTKPISFFVVSEILGFRKPDPASAYCFIEVKFKEAPFDLKETLVTYFVESDEAEEFFKAADATPLPPQTIAPILGSNHVTLFFESTEISTLKVVQLSAKTMKVFGEIGSNPPEPGMVVDLEPSQGEAACAIRASVASVIPSSEAPGFATIDLELQFSSCIVSKMRKFFKPN